jgi:hypothetical protein
MRIKLNKQLKIEGIAILILFLLFVIGAIFAFVFPDSLGNYRIFAIMLTSPLLLMALIAVLIYWIYQVFKYQKSH